MSNPKWTKGVSGNPAGRPLGSKNKFSLADLQKSLDKAKANHENVSLLDHVCEKAYTDNVIAIAILKKMLPDLKRITAAIDLEATGFARMTPDGICDNMDKSTMGDKGASSSN